MLQREPHLVDLFPGRSSEEHSSMHVSTDSDEWFEELAAHEAYKVLHVDARNRALGESRKASWPRTIKEALSRPDAKLWKEAITKEATSVLSKGTIKDARWVRGVSTKPLPLMWVLTMKYKEDGSVEKYKARLVVLGNQAAELWVCCCRRSHCSCDKIYNSANLVTGGELQGMTNSSDGCGFCFP